MKFNCSLGLTCGTISKVDEENSKDSSTCQNW